MSKLSFPYPPGPINVPTSVTESSPAFKKEVKSVLSSIVLFFIVYLLLFILAIGLSAACVAGGIFIVSVIRHIIAILAGIGLIGVGIMVLVFLVKFLFAVSKFDRSGSVEIKEAEQPQLFAFIRQLTIDTQTPFPKKIYLSPEVNACVFYDSSFWSMFLPVKKNLQIGLGLVNALNLSEFKSVMAHEFGHFSQRSMKLGSFVYQVNRIIFNMLYDNNSYGNFLRSAASVSDTFALFVGITVKIVQGIQWILQKMYAIINRSYMSLSREMEFHADAVAASVSGSNNCISALQRIELAGSGYQLVINKYDELYKEKIVAQNIYPNHRAVLNQLASEFNLSVVNELPVVNRDFLNGNNLSRVNYKDQWASHPTTEERENHLNALGLVVETDNSSAWVLFSEKEKLQEILTRKLYQHVTIDANAVAINNSEFTNRYLHDESKYSLPKSFNGFYDARNNTILDVEKEIKEPEVTTTFESLFSPENASIPKKINALESDIELLKSIAAKQVDTKTFDFDGEKYDRLQAGEIVKRLEVELATQKQTLETLDKNAFRFFYQSVSAISPEKGERIKADFAEYYRLRNEGNSYLDHVNKMLGALQPIYSGQTIPIVTINALMATLKESHEKLFKEKLGEWMRVGAFDSNPSLKQKINQFIGANYFYFSNDQFFETELADLNQIAVEGWQYIYEFMFIRLKKLLSEQAP